MKRLLFLISVAVLLVSACAQAAPTNTPAAAPYRAVSAAELKSMLQNKDFVLVNVHIPYVAEIEGTDLFVPYNEIEQNLGKLPSDKAARIVVYCQSGAMSKTASGTLVGLGYNNIIDLSGGMLGWEKAGYQLVRKPR